MENSVKKRILQLKTELGLTDVEFCGKASISTGTLHRIKNDEEVSKKTLNSFEAAFNVNKDWLLTGKGKMFIAAPKEEEAANPWRDALVSQLKEENAKLWQMLQHFTAAKPNFRKALEHAYSFKYLPGLASLATNSGAKTLH